MRTLFFAMAIFLFSHDVTADAQQCAEIQNLAVQQVQIVTQQHQLEEQSETLSFSQRLSLTKSIAFQAVTLKKRARDLSGNTRGGNLNDTVVRLIRNDNSNQYSDEMIYNTLRSRISSMTSASARAIDEAIASTCSNGQGATQVQSVDAVQ
jgi:hypothetical protein